MIEGGANELRSYMESKDEVPVHVQASAGFYFKMKEVKFRLPFVMTVRLTTYHVPNIRLLILNSTQFLQQDISNRVYLFRWRRSISKVWV